MSSGAAVPFALAYEAACCVIANLSPYATRIEIAGSIRRHLSRYGSAGAVPASVTVGDVELVALPRHEERETITARTLFGTEAEYARVNLLWERLDRLSGGDDRPYGPYLKRNKHGREDRKWGDRYRRLCAPVPSQEGRGGAVTLIPCDLFCATPEGWGATYCIRTGPGGYDGTRRGRWSIALVNADKERVTFGEGRVLVEGRPYPVPTELDVFDLLGLPYLAPHERERVRLTWMGKNRPPAFWVEGMRFSALAQACEWVKERRVAA